MQVQALPKSTDYAEAIASLVAELPADRAAQLYDFARFLQSQSASSQSDDEDDWLNDSEEQMQAEDALWEATFVRYPHITQALADEATAELEAGETQPLFDENGNIMI